MANRGRDRHTDDDQAVLDALSAKVYDSIVRARFRPLFADHQTIDIGTAVTTALVVTVDEMIVATTALSPTRAYSTTTDLGRLIPA